MNKLPVLFGSVALTLAVGAGYLFGELRAERARADALQARVAELENPGSTTAPSGESHEARTATPVSSAPALTTAKKRFPAGEGAGMDGAEFARQLADPQIRAAQLAFTRLELEREYPDLATALNLQPDEAARLLDLLAKQALEQREYEMLGNDAGRLTDEAARARQQQDAERRQQVVAERTALLGEAKLAEWREYVKTLKARADLRELQTMLAETNYPMRSDQVTSMVAALATEQQRHATERDKLYNSMGNPTNSSPEETIHYLDERLTLIEQTLQRRHQLATAYLSTEQLKRYDQMLSLDRKRAQIDHDSFVATNRYAARNRARP